MEPNDDITYLLQDLNDAQREAVTAPPEHRLVLAGAGSGKTRVLVHRIAWLIAVENVSPLSILAVTFTNKAANEMRGRIEALLGMPVRPLWIGTFHGIAHRMLRLHWKEAGLRQDFQILDADDQQRLVKRVIRQLDLPEDQWPHKAVTGWINGAKEEGRRPEDFDDLGDFTMRQYVRIYTAYQQSCENQGLVDFSELLLRAYELCRNNADIQAHYRRKFRHLLVDEFQDTNMLQYRWLRTLAGEQGLMFAVGDDDQSIYGWRGARIENILNFPKDYRGCEVIRLEQNYRSTGNILAAANGLIAHNTGRMGKELWTDGREGEAIELYAAFNEYDEAEFVTNRIRDYLDGVGRYSDCAILYRSNAQSRVLEETLIRARLPYRIYGGLRFFERQEVKDALAWMRLLANRNDDVSFERALGSPPSGVGATSLERLREIARAGGGSLWASARHAHASIGRSAKALLGFLDKVDSIAALTREMTLDRVMETLINQSGLRDHYSKEKGEQAEARLENLDELINAARSFVRPDEEGMDPMSAFLSHAALEAGEAQASAGEDCVQLMTLHSAKGLEFPVVFIVGMENGLFPSMRAIDEGHLEEERRLAYVGITRARKKLYLTHAEMRRIHGQEQIGSPSQFIREIPPANVVEVRPRAGIARPMFAARSPFGHSSGGGGLYRGGSKPISGMDNMVAGLKLGQRVMHSKFGEGTVLSFKGSDDRAQVEVRFREAGTKWLAVALAKLTPLG